MGRYVIKTLGCKANLADSERLEASLRARGWSSAGDESLGLCIVNSCTVTDEAEKQSRKLAARLKRENPGARVVMTGCSAEVDPEGLRRSPGVDFVVGNQDKPRLAELVLGRVGSSPEGQVLGSVTGYREMASRHPMDREWPAPAVPFEQVSSDDRTRNFLKIQEGCDAFCTYCVIPYGRGPSRSLRIQDLVAQVRALAEGGVREIVLTGTNIGDYGADWAGTPQLEALVERLLGETGIERIRLSSLDPVEITPRLVSLLEADSRLCPHFHVSLQSPHSRILKLMKRKYAFEQVRECLERIAAARAPAGGVFVGMDLITGFPGETLEEFEWGVARLAELPWSRLHVFPYSERKGTPATRLPGSVTPSERARRAGVLRRSSLERLQTVYHRAGAELRARGQGLEGVLLERPTRGPDGTRRWVAGYSPNYLRAVLRSPEGEELPVRNQVVTVEPGDLLVDPASGDVSFLGELALIADKCPVFNK